MRFEITDNSTNHPIVRSLTTDDLILKLYFSEEEHLTFRFAKENVFVYQVQGEFQIAAMSEQSYERLKEDLPKVYDSDHQEEMSWERADSLVEYVVDDALNGRRVFQDQYAIVYKQSVLVGWERPGREPIFVSTHSYLGRHSLSDEEAIELAADYLVEIGEIEEGLAVKPNYVLRKG